MEKSVKGLVMSALKLFSEEVKTKYNGVQENVIEEIKVNGAAQTVTDKVIDISVPTKVSDLANDNNYQTAEQVSASINAKISSTYRAGGSATFASLPELAEDNLGLVVNVTDKFTTTDSFVEGAGAKHTAGTNVVVVKIDDEYKYDVLSGFVDLSGYDTAAKTASDIAAAKEEAITQATAGIDGKLSECLKASDLEEITAAEIKALFSE